MTFKSINQNHFNKEIVFNFNTKQKEDNKVVNIALEIITEKIKKEGIKKKYNFNVQTEGSPQLLHIKLFPSGSPSSFDIQVEFLSFKDLATYDGSPSSEESFLAYLQTLTSITVESPSPSFTLVNGINFDVINKNAVDPEIINEALLFISKKMHQGKTENNYNFYLLNDGIYQLLHLEISKKGGVFEVNNICIGTFENARAFFPEAPSIKNHFIKHIKKAFPRLEIPSKTASSPSHKKIKNSKSMDLNSDSKHLTPPLYEPSAWLEDIQSVLDHSDLRWVKKMNENSYAAALPDPSYVLESVFKEKLSLYTIHGVKQQNNAFQKIVGWIIFTQKLLKLENTAEKASMLQKLRIGEIINQCASLLIHVPSEMIDDLGSLLAVQINLTAAQVLETMSMYYFFESVEWKKAIKSLRTDSPKNDHFPILTQTLNIILDRKKDVINTCVLAWDTFEKRLLLANSGRSWGVFPQNIKNWNATREMCTFSLPNNPLFFTDIAVKQITMQILFRITYVFSQFSDKNHKSINSPKSINDVNTVRGRFAHLVSDLYNSRPNIEDRITMLSLMHCYFNQALPPEQWNALLHLAEKEDVSELDVMAIVMRGKTTKEQHVAMFLCNYTCGEGKIALECYRALGQLSSKQRQQLPETLGERLLFSAVRAKKEERVRGTPIFIGKHEAIQKMEICEKCHDAWHAFEALYWSFQQTGINLHILEKLEKLIVAKKKI